MSSWAPTRYKTTNWSSYNSSLKQRGSLSIWFDPEMIWTPPPTGRRGRRCEFSDAAIQTCLTLKVLFGMPLRQTTGFVQSLLQLVGLDWPVPDFSTLCRRQRKLNVAIGEMVRRGQMERRYQSKEVCHHPKPNHTQRSNETRAASVVGCRDGP